MLTSDVGPKTTQAILGRLRESLDRSELADVDAVWAALRAEAVRILGEGGGPIRVSARPTVVLMVGVNGVGKTTTIGKLATRFNAAGKKVLLAAGDTFRAAAVQQLEVWGKRVGSEVVKGKEGADPGAVAFDATNRARDAQSDLLLVDTAGRLHTKAPLMDEIKKVRKTIAKAMEGAPHETLLVLDATTGQNALVQAAMFKEAVDLTGIVLTKLDGTAKGGVVLAICDELQLPVRYIGLGERGRRPARVQRRRLRRGALRSARRRGPRRRRKRKRDRRGGRGVVKARLTAGLTRREGLLGHLRSLDCCLGRRRNFRSR